MVPLWVEGEAHELQQPAVAEEGAECPLAAYQDRRHADIVFPFASFGENRQRESNESPTDVAYACRNDRVLTFQGERAEGLGVFLIDYGPRCTCVEKGQSRWKRAKANLYVDPRGRFLGGDAVSECGPSNDERASVQ